MKFVAGIPRSPEDYLYCFLGSGVEGESDGLDCQAADGKVISAWLDDNQDYLQHVKTL